MNSILKGISNNALKKGYSINISQQQTMLEVNLIKKKRIKRFRNIDSSMLLSQINNYLQA